MKWLRFPEKQTVIAFNDFIILAAGLVGGWCVTQRCSSQCDS